MGNLRKMSSLRQVVSDLNMELAAFEASLNNEFDEASFSKPAQCRVQKQPAATTQNEDRDFEVDFQGLRHEDKRSKHPTDARSQPIQASGEYVDSAKRKRQCYNDDQGREHLYDKRARLEEEEDRSHGQHANTAMLPRRSRSRSGDRGYWPQERVAAQRDARDREQGRWRDEKPAHRGWHHEDMYRTTWSAADVSRHFVAAR